jgi:hypothetical protein
MITVIYYKMIMIYYKYHTSLKTEPTGVDQLMVPHSMDQLLALRTNICLPCGACRGQNTLAYSVNSGKEQRFIIL